MKFTITLGIIFLFQVTLFSQKLSGEVIEESSLKGLFGVKITSSEGQHAITDTNGLFTIPYTKLPVQLFLKTLDDFKDTILVNSTNKCSILISSISEQKDVVVSSSRRRQKREDVPISMEVLKPQLIQNKGSNDLEQALEQVPGVFAMDGQISIRGGSGFAYGAGSRVALLWNGLPLLSGDAGDAKWNTIPLEAIGQVEVMKGASSVLYGSGALNGIIAVSEKEPTTKQQVEVKIQSGMYGNPKRETLKWWSNNPLFHSTDVYASKSYQKMGYTITASGFTSDGYRQGETEDRARVGVSLYFKPSRLKNTKFALGVNAQTQKTGNFIIWQSDTFAYQPFGGADTSISTSTLTYNRGFRFSVDPSVKWIDKHKGIHQLRTRYYFVDNQNFTNTSQSSNSTVALADYQFQRKINNHLLTSGVNLTKNTVSSFLFGDHIARNYAWYVQDEWNLKKWTFTAGLRAEYYQQDQLDADSYFYVGKDSSRLPVYPIARLAAVYKLKPSSIFRASFGQGVRYPTVAERFTQTSVGSLNIFPNPSLQRETGWAAELGYKQLLKLGDWKAYLDIAGFVNQYQNMMEFTFDFYLPDSITPSINPNDPGYIPKWFGFMATNAEKARISGLEFSFASEGKINQLEITTLIGYTYMNPISLNADSIYRSTFSDTTTNMLKYRFKHLAKADVEVKWKRFTLGASLRYNSFMKNIDAIFETKSAGIEILPGLKTYRQLHNIGMFVIDLRTGFDINSQFRIGFMINNLLNAEYMTRPGDIQAPRTFLVQVKYALH